MNPSLISSAGSLLSILAVVTAPVVLIAFLAIPDRVADRLGPRFATFGASVGLGVFGLALFAAVFCFVKGPLIFGSKSFGPLSVDIYFDVLSAVMLLLVAFLGAVVLRFSVNYLAGHPRQGRFTKWLAVTIGSVLTLIVSGNLLLFAFAWVATSLSLHQLLVFHGDRPASILAAYKKFFFSRLGDVCLIAALVMIWQCFGSLKFTAIFQAADTLREQGDLLPSCLVWSSALLVACALLKSAQFPFHSWLPDTMETPTPVSALMHAGIINAGGFLIVRLSPIIASSPGVLNFLALIGAFTALFASLIMLTQTSVKRSLAYSTIAQMGFMMLQCGLGAFALAILHIVAHSLYKAHAFLSSGGIVNLSASSWVPSERPAAHPLVIMATLITAAITTWGVSAFFGTSSENAAAMFLLVSIFMMALAYMLWNLWASSHRASLIGWGLLLGLVATVAYFLLHAGFESLLALSLPPYAPSRSLLEYAVMALIVLLFTAVLILQSLLPIWSATPLGRQLYVHASQGFYLGAIANRIALALLRKPTV